MEDSHNLREEIVEGARRAQNFLSLDLSTTSTLNENTNQPILVVQSPKTPTLSKKFKAVSLDLEPCQKSSLDVTRDVSSVPNTPKKYLKPANLKYIDDKTLQTSNSEPFAHTPTNLKTFSSNTNITSSQLLKTLPEIMTLQDFSDNRPKPVKIKAKGLLERRGSNASLTIDLGNSTKSLDNKVMPLKNFNSIKSVSHINLTTVGTEKCSCSLKTLCESKSNQNNSENVLGNCSTQLKFENLDKNVQKGSESKTSVCKNRCYTFHKKCNCLCNFKCRRKSLSNENLYIPPCSYCQSKNISGKCGTTFSRHCKGCKRTVYPRQAGLYQPQVLSEDFKLHLQNIQYLQTAGNLLSLNDLKSVCEPTRVPKLHQEFWEVPLNLQEKCIVSGSQSKNRYKGVLPNEHSRVHLSEKQDYIHANYIKGPDYTESCYIATQGPMSHTCEDFWEMVWNNKCKCIVMLTGLVEKGRSKCELYFPLGKNNANGTEEKSFYNVTTTKVLDRFTFDFKNNKQYEEKTIAFEELDEVSFGNFKIKFISKYEHRFYTVRVFEVSNKEESRQVHHFWYSKWQDHKMTSPEEVLELAVNVLKCTEDGVTNNNEKRNDSDNNSFNSEVSVDNNGNQDMEDTKKIPKTLRTSTWHKELAKLQEEIKQNLLKKSQSALDYFTAPKDMEANKIEKFSKKTNTNLFLSLKSSLSSEKAPILTKSSESSSADSLSLECDISSCLFSKDGVAEPKAPIVVHCSAGIGRTGCFLAILNGIRQLKNNRSVDVLAILCSLRLNRGGMVQTAEQYELIHRVLKLYADKL